MRFLGFRREPLPVDPNEGAFVASVVRKGEATLPKLFADRLQGWRDTSAFVPGSHWKAFFAMKIMNHFLTDKEEKDDELAYIYADAGDAVGKRVSATWDDFWKQVRRSAVEHYRDPSRRPPPRLEAAE